MNAARWLLAATLAALAAFLPLVLDPVAAAAVAALAAGIATLSWRDRPLPAPPPSLPEDRGAPRLPDLIEAVGDPLLLTHDRVVTHANASAHALFGEHILNEDVLLAIRHPLAAARLTADHVDAPPLLFSGLGGPDRHWELEIRAIDAHRRVVRLSDRTAARAAERMRTDFVANASHELRTPLANLLGYIETLEDPQAGENPATRKRFLRIMEGEARRMQRLIDDLMSLSRIEADRHVAPRDRISLAALAEEVRTANFTGIGAASGRIELDLAADLPEVTGDRAQLSQLLYNLVGNALKYGGQGKVTVTAEADEGTVRMQVRDRGDGIAPEHLPRLTERFYRVDAGRSRALGGTGLGLAIVKHIVERHRGRLDIGSVQGQGTTVSVWLPIAVTKPSSYSHATGAGAA